MKIIVEEIKNIKSTRKELREFGLVVGGVLLLIGIYLLWKGSPSTTYLVTPGALLIATALAYPAVLKPLQKAWMALAVVLGFFISRVILSILFYIVFTAIGLLLRLKGQDLLDRKIDKNRKTYWNHRPDKERPPKYYERQF